MNHFARYNPEAYERQEREKSCPVAHLEELALLRKENGEDEENES